MIFHICFIFNGGETIFCKIVQQVAFPHFPWRALVSRKYCFIKLAICVITSLSVLMKINFFGCKSDFISGFLRSSRKRRAMGLQSCQEVQAQPPDRLSQHPVTPVMLRTISPTFSKQPSWTTRGALMRANCWAARGIQAQRNRGSMKSPRMPNELLSNMPKKCLAVCWKYIFRKNRSLVIENFFTIHIFCCRSFTFWDTHVQFCGALKERF